MVAPLPTPTSSWEHLASRHFVLCGRSAPLGKERLLVLSQSSLTTCASTYFVLAEYGGVVHDPVGVCSIAGHHHNPKLPNNHLHLGATQSGESFITTPHKACCCLLLPPHTMKAGLWMEIQSEFETISKAFGQNLELSSDGGHSKWSAVERHRVKSYH